MKKLLLLALLALLPVVADAQQSCFGPSCSSGGGGVPTNIPSGTPTDCTALSVWRTSALQLLECGLGLTYDAGVLSASSGFVSGSVTTAARSVLTIRDTISGASATSNFLNITGTFPGTLSAETNGVMFSFTGDNDARLQTGVKSVYATGGSALDAAAVWGEISGISANSTSAAVWGQNSSTDTSGTGNRIGVLGFQNANAAVRSAGVVGAVYNANGASTGVGVYGIMTGANNATQSAGVAGSAWSTATAAIGGYFTLNTSAATDPGQSGLPTIAGKAALVGDNGAIAANIFEARDNATLKWRVMDGGHPVYATTIPAVSNTSANSCGTTAATIAGTSETGIITVGATAGTSCTMTFPTAAPTRRQCMVNNETTTANLVQSTYSSTTVSVFVGTFVAGDVISYYCAVY